MNPDLIEIFKVLGTSLGVTSLTAVGIWKFGKEWILERLKAGIKSEYDHKLASYQSDLKRIADVELESVRSYLAIQAAERNIRFSRVFEKVAEVMANIYRILVEINDAAMDHSSYLGKDEKHHEDAVKRFQEKRNEFFQYYEPNQIYIPKQTRESIRVFVNTLHSLVLTTSHLEQAAKMGSDAGFESRNRKLELLFEQVPKLRSALDDEFQRILGLEESKPHNPTAQDRIIPAVIVEPQTKPAMLADSHDGLK
jgi:hypothetical protein